MTASLKNKLNRYSMSSEKYTLNKHCEQCGVPVPDSFGNLLCLVCYNRILSTTQKVLSTTQQPVNSINASNSHDSFDNGIRDPNYQENPEAEDKEQWMANITMFGKLGKLLYGPTRSMYEFVNRYNLDKVTRHPQYPKFIWKPTIVDVGCGAGFGSNVLSQEADFIWGIDKNETSIKFAQEAFTRVKNGIYYSSQVTFDHIDIVKDTREFMRFDEVVAIEVIEHVYDFHAFLTMICQKLAKKNTQVQYHVPDPTEFFISTPNRNSDSIRKDKPFNKYHVREWTSQEFRAVLENYFEHVELLNVKGEPVPDDTPETPILAHCLFPKV